MEIVVFSRFVPSTVGFVVLERFHLDLGAGLSVWLCGRLFSFLWGALGADCNLDYFAYDDLYLFERLLGVRNQPDLGLRFGRRCAHGRARFSRDDTAPETGCETSLVRNSVNCLVCLPGKSLRNQ